MKNMKIIVLLLALFNSANAWVACFTPCAAGCTVSGPASPACIAGCGILCAALSGPLCFHRTTKVELANGTTVPINELKPGQSVLSLDAGRNVVETMVETVKLNEKLQTFYRLVTSESEILLTSGHPVPFIQNGTYKVTPVENVKIGFHLVSKSGRPSKVIRIETWEEKGSVTINTSNVGIITNGFYMAAACAGHMDSNVDMDLEEFIHKITTSQLE